MNDSNALVNVCTKEKVFYPKNEDWGVYCEDHRWKIFVFDPDSTVGISVCTKCARMKSGWIRDE